MATTRIRISNSGGRSSRYIAARESAAVPGLPTYDRPTLEADSYYDNQQQIFLLHQSNRKRTTTKGFCAPKVQRKKPTKFSDRSLDVTFSSAE